jgi:hypothetical protein
LTGHDVAGAADACVLPDIVCAEAATAKIIRTQTSAIRSNPIRSISISSN